MTTAPLDLDDGRLASDYRTEHEPLHHSHILIGIAVAALLPAWFWAMVAWMVGRAVGYEPSTGALLALAGCIAVFLAAVCSALFINPEQRYTRS
jgi:hypothetical protein